MTRMRTKPPLLFCLIHWTTKSTLIIPTMPCMPCQRHPTSRSRQTDRAVALKSLPLPRLLPVEGDLAAVERLAAENLARNPPPLLFLMCLSCIKNTNKVTNKVISSTHRNQVIGMARPTQVSRQLRWHGVTLCLLPSLPRDGSCSPMDYKKIMYHTPT